MSNFTLEILTPGRSLFKGEVSEVVLPGFDGEDGILDGHENFVGALETGVLKFVHSGNDYWFMVSSGVFEVREREVSVLADVAEEATEVDLEASKSSLEELEEKVSNLSSYSAEYKRAKVEFDRARARLEVHRRTQLN